MGVMRRSVATVLLGIVVLGVNVLPVSASHNMYNPVRKWAVRNESGYTRSTSRWPGSWAVGC